MPWCGRPTAASVLFSCLMNQLFATVATQTDHKLSPHASDHEKILPIIISDLKFDDNLLITQLYNHKEFVTPQIIVSDLQNQKKGVAMTHDFLQKILDREPQVKYILSEPAKIPAPHEVDYVKENALLNTVSLTDYFSKDFPKIPQKRVMIFQIAPMNSKTVGDILGNISTRLSAYFLISMFNAHQEDHPQTLAFLNSLQIKIKEQNELAFLLYSDNWQSFDKSTGSAMPYEKLLPYVPLDHLDRAAWESFHTRQIFDAATWLAQESTRVEFQPRYLAKAIYDLGRLPNFRIPGEKLGKAPPSLAEAIRNAKKVYDEQIATEKTLRKTEQNSRDSKKTKNEIGDMESDDSQKENGNIEENKDNIMELKTNDVGDKYNSEDNKNDMGEHRESSEITKENRGERLTLAEPKNKNRQKPSLLVCLSKEFSKMLSEQERTGEATLTYISSEKKNMIHKDKNGRSVIRAGEGEVLHYIVNTARIDKTEIDKIFNQELSEFTRASPEPLRKLDRKFVASRMEFDVINGLKRYTVEACDGLHGAVWLKKLFSEGDLEHGLSSIRNQKMTFIESAQFIVNEQDYVVANILDRDKITGLTPQENTQAFILVRAESLDPHQLLADNLRGDSLTNSDRFVPLSTKPIGSKELSSPFSEELEETKRKSTLIGQNGEIEEKEEVSAPKRRKLVNLKEGIVPDDEIELPESTKAMKFLPDVHF